MGVIAHILYIMREVTICLNYDNIKLTLGNIQLDRGAFILGCD